MEIDMSRFFPDDPGYTMRREEERDDLIAVLMRQVLEELLAECDPDEEIDMDYLSLEAECEAVQKVERMERNWRQSCGESRIHMAMADSYSL